jgi:hypothetical protein
MEGRREIAELISDHVRYGGEVAAALDKTIVTLSGAALVFSMTFADRLAPARLWLPILFLSWFAFAMAILSVIFAFRTLQNSMSKKADELNQMSNEFEKHLAEGKVGSAILSITRERKGSCLEPHRHLVICVGNSFSRCLCWQKSPRLALIYAAQPKAGICDGEIRRFIHQSKILSVIWERMG